jgi:kynurenine 3-monooxygenase
LLNGAVQFQPHGKDDQALYSVSRQPLNELLLSKLEENENVTLRFHTKVARMLLKQRGKSDEIIKPKLVIGADGSHRTCTKSAFSSVRNSLIKIARINNQQAFIKHGYRELTLLAVLYTLIRSILTSNSLLKDDFS